jgi:hypothetical protein
MASVAQLCQVAKQSLGITHVAGCPAGPSVGTKQVPFLVGSRGLDGNACRAGGSALRSLVAKESSARQAHHAQRLTPVCESSRDSHSAAEEAPAVSRRNLLSAGAGLALSLSTLTTSRPATAADIDLEEWEQVDLPLEPGVVLLDVAFVPNDPNHGEPWLAFLLSKFSSSG